MIVVGTERRRCIVTGKQVASGDGFSFGEHNAYFVSWEGMRRHLEAQAALQKGDWPKQCQDCNTPFSREAVLFLHHKDGLYQCLCRSCSDRYEALLRDRLRDTPYGARNQL